MNGMLDTSSGTTFMNTATYSCDDGYGLMGDMTRTCQSDGIWSLTAPTCRGESVGFFIVLYYSVLTAICPDISCPNGMIVYNPSTTPRLEGTTATHTCNTGYRPDPGETLIVRTCQSNGEWTITDRVCECMLLQ